jgi:hypothetical protein
VARIHKVKKQPTNYNWKEKKTYWTLTISGQDNLKKFTEHIGFISQKKKEGLAEALQKPGNTNVDVVPGVDKIFQEIYQLFGCQLHRIQDISNIKRQHYTPSPDKLREMIGLIEKRVERFRALEPSYRTLAELPSLSSLIELGRKDRALNRKLWQVLKQSWRVVKNKGVKPGARNVFKMLQVVENKTYQLGEVKNAIYSGFQELDLPVKYFNRSLQTALVDRYENNTDYEMIQTASLHVWQSYQDTLLNKLPKVEALLERLRVLANAELLWDPIVKIKKIINKTDKYVYDLTCENSVFLAGHGGMFVHNSYFCKLEVLRYLMQGTDVIIIDPENEYEFLVDAVGGSYFKIALNSQHHINPFDLPLAADQDPKDILRSSVINLVGLIRMMLGGLSAEEDAIVDRALAETYAAKDITPESDSAAWRERTPLLSDFEAVLSGMEGTHSLVERLQKFTQGSYAQFFNNPSNVSLDKNFIVFGIRDVEDELRPMAMFIILRYIWTQVRSSLKRRILLVDEAWWIMQYEDGASFLYGLCKRARKYWLGVSTITQDVSDFMKSSYGRPIITNSSLQFLMKQSPATIGLVQKTFNLTEGEKNTLLESSVGEGVFIAGQKRIAIKVVASYVEDQIITSAPEEVKKLRAAKKRMSQL